MLKNKVNHILQNKFLLIAVFAIFSISFILAPVFQSANASEENLKEAKRVAVPIPVADGAKPDVSKIKTTEAQQDNTEPTVTYGTVPAEDIEYIEKGEYKPDFASAEETEQASPVKKGKGVMILQGTMDNGSFSVGTSSNYTINDYGTVSLSFNAPSWVPSDAIVTDVYYSFRIDDNGTDTFYCVDYEVYLSNSSHSWTFLNVYNNLGGTYDNGYDDDSANDSDIYVNYRHTNAFDGESAKQYWRCRFRDTIGGGRGYIDYVYIYVYYEYNIIKSLKLTSPNGGECWEVGKNYPVTWTSNPPNVGKVTVEITTNNGATWWAGNNMKNLPNNGSFTYHVYPENVSNQVRFRVKSASNPTIYDKSNGTLTVAYQCNGGKPDIDVNPKSWTFNAVNPGAVDEKAFNIKNTGNANLHVSSTMIAGADASQFSIISGGGGFTLTPNASRNLTVRFAPTTTGTKMANLYIYSNDPDENPVVVNLIGGGCVIPAIFDFNDGTAQCWSLYGAFNEYGNGPFASNFNFSWADNTNFPGNPYADPFGDLNGALRMYTANGHGLVNTGGNWWIMVFDSPDLSTSPEWQALQGFTGKIANAMSGGTVYCNVYLTVYDNDQMKERYFYNGTAQPLSHYTNQLWNEVSIDWSSSTVFPTNYVLKNVSFYIWGNMANTPVGSVYLDDVGPKCSLTSIKVKYPNGGETWKVGNSYDITWETDCPVGQVYVEISTTGGATWWDVTQGKFTPNDGKYTYKPVVQNVSHACLFRIRSVEQPSVQDASDNFFKITYSEGQPKEIADEASGTPTEFRLQQNYPNPFNPETVIRFDLPEAADVVLSVYNTQGQLVRTLADGNLGAGYQSFRWDGRNSAGESMAAGLYIYKLDVVGTTKRTSFTRKMLLMK